jgi:TonB family protein
MGPNGVYRIGNGVSPPVLTTKVEPGYSEAGRKLRAEGTVLLSIAIQPDGTARDFRVLTSLGFGLDEKAIEAVWKWRFKPSMKDGMAVTAEAQVNVNFHQGWGWAGPWWASGTIAFPSEASVAPPVFKDGTMPKADYREFSNESAVLEFTVDSSGSVKNIHAIYGSESASELLRGSLATWTFLPALKGNQSVEATGRVRFVKGEGDEAAKLPLWLPRSQSNPSQPGTALLAPSLQRSCDAPQVLALMQNPPPLDGLLLRPHCAKSNRKVWMLTFVTMAASLRLWQKPAQIWQPRSATTGLVCRPTDHRAGSNCHGRSRYTRLNGKPTAFSGDN